jgi:hypothetical protein
VLQLQVSQLEGCKQRLCILLDLQRLLLHCDCGTDPAVGGSMSSSSSDSSSIRQQ